MKCAVVIPVGPGHENDFAVCRHTVEQAWERGHGPFDGLEILPMWDLQGEHGRSARRNDGIALAREKGCEWLFFLDADDLMNSSAFERMAPHHQQYDAVWGNICECTYGSNQFILRPGQLTKTDRLLDILQWPAYKTLQMGHFVRTACAAEIGFDTAMDTGEDFKYYLGLWERFRCAKVEEIFFINQRGHHATGPRSAAGRDWNVAVDQLLLEATLRHAPVVEVTADGKTVRFAGLKSSEGIQFYHRAGKFFDAAQLNSLKSLVGPGKTIVELGVNVGNHVIFYASHMEAARIYPFEANPARVAALRHNLRLNGLEAAIDDRGLGVQVGRAGDAAAVALDQVMDGIRVDFIRMDVGGRLFDVLDGARALIAASRPQMYVNLTTDQVPVFDAWMAANDYGVTGMAQQPNGVGAFVGPQ